MTAASKNFSGESCKLIFFYSEKFNLISECVILFDVVKCKKLCNMGSLVLRLVMSCKSDIITEN